MQLEIILLSEVTQKEKDKYHMKKAQDQVTSQENSTKHLERS